MRSRHGFTLVELLVVVAIIAMLIAILLPSLTRARWTAATVVCSSTFRQGVVSLNAYAMDNHGYFPRHDFTLSGRNPWDLAIKTAAAFIDYGYAPKMWVCPVRGEPAWGPPTVDQFPSLGKDEYLRQRAGHRTVWMSWYQSYWAPRLSANSWVPAYGDADLTPTEDNWPSSLRSRVLAHKPVISDFMTTHTVYTGTLDDPQSALGGHPFNQAVETTGAAYGDGHVEVHRVPAEVRHIPNPSWSGWAWY